MIRKKQKQPSASARAVGLSALLVLLGSLCSLAAQDYIPEYRPGSEPMLLTGLWHRYAGYIDETAAQSGLPSDRAMVPLRESIFATPTAPVAPSSYRYMLRISGPPGPHSYTLCVPDLRDYRTVSVNGTTLYDSSSDAPGSPMLYFNSSSDLLSIIIHCAPGAPSPATPGALVSVPYFGEAAAVDSSKSLLTGWVFVLVTFFALGGLFMLVLFTFWRKNWEFLGFSFFLLASALFYIFKYAALFQSIPWFLGLQRTQEIYVASMSLLLCGLSAFVYTMFRAELPRLPMRILVFLPFLIAPAVFLLPSGFLVVYRLATAYSGLLAVGMLALVGVELVRGNPRARWLGPAALPWAASIVCSAVLRDSFTSAFFFEPIGQVLFAFVAWLMLVKKVGDTFESVETLSDYVASVSTTVRKFIPQEFLESLDKSDVTDLRLGDHVRKQMTIFFSDIRAFTELSEKLTVEENFAFINSYLSRVVPIVKGNGGFIDKYIGDAIMALFPGPNGPDEAIRSAIAMQGKIVEYNGHRAKMGYRPISMGVGIHSGDLMLGVVGVHDRMENTVISDAVNLASRLQAISKSFNISMVISEQAFKELEDPGLYKYRFIGKVRVKGKAAPVSVFEIYDGIAPDLFERKMKANMFFEQGMLSYYQKDFAGAMYYFKRVLDIIPEDGAAGFYLDTCMNKAAL
ncbi:MAG TPA: adenylate/guanylate cyclase domain-containing protein [Rectinemataceae bacterium]|nr:adenylate/guanylate cyclase domain-containing protein [Rectinemataceae bacterium]